MFLRKALATVFHTAGVTHLAARQKDSWRIIMYHRIVDPESVPYPIQSGMVVRPETFRAHLRYLSASCKLVSLEALAATLARGEEPAKGTVAITFDDGWHDNLTHALPILKEFGAPATVFVATSFVGNKRLFWTDAAGLIVAKIQREKIADRATPSRERLDRATLLEMKDLYRALQSLPADIALEHVMSFLSSISRTRRREFMTLFASTLQEEGTAPPQSFLSWEDIRELQANGIAIGSHSSLHEPLSELSEEELESDINSSYEEFRAHGITPSLVFCYPGGSYNDMTQTVLAEKGIRFALSVETRTRMHTTPLLLGRIAMHDDVSNTPALFASRLWLDRVFV